MFCGLVIFAVFLFTFFLFYPFPCSLFLNTVGKLLDTNLYFYNFVPSCAGHCTTVAVDVHRFRPFSMHVFVTCIVFRVFVCMFLFVARCSPWHLLLLAVSRRLLSNASGQSCRFRMFLDNPSGTVSRVKGCGNSADASGHFDFSFIDDHPCLFPLPSGNAQSWMVFVLSRILGFFRDTPAEKFLCIFFVSTLVIKLFYSTVVVIERGFTRWSTRSSSMSAAASVSTHRTHPLRCLHQGTRCNGSAR